MSMTIIFSGPQGKVQQARKALKIDGFEIVLDREGNPTLNDWGHLPDSKPTAFVTAEGDDLDSAVASVEPHGYRLRGHWNNDTDIQVEALFGDGFLTLEERLARIESDLVIMKGAK